MPTLRALLARSRSLTGRRSTRGAVSWTTSALVAFPVPSPLAAPVLPERFRRPSKE